MCGIVGIVADGGSVLPETLERATQSLAHRGPDDHGTVIIRTEIPRTVEIGLGNRRLAVLDLSPLGHQPMQDPATKNWIAYNGEIYNFKQLRARLENEGDRFVSNSDTEVILKGYARWGESIVSELRGMFAFAIWDARNQRLFLARDPMGIKPLYYFQSDRHFVFASEVRTLLGTGLVPRQLDEVGLLSYLTFGSVCDPFTLIKGVLALPPGNSLVWDAGSLKRRQYWDLAEKNSSDGAPPTDQEIYSLIDESVRMQLVSDVPVGVFLSGGIDSSALAGILVRSGIKPSTFSIVFREADYSEAEYSRAVAQHFQTDHHEITVSQQDVLELIPAALKAMDQPTMDGVNTHFVSQKTREAGVKVALSGLGGDEVFAGYSSFRDVPRMERFAGMAAHIPGIVRKSFAKAYATVTPTSDQNRKLASLIRDNGRLIHPYFLSRMLFTPRQTDSLLANTPAPGPNGLASTLRDIEVASQALDPINRVSYLEERCYMLNTLLRDSDSMSMAHGLEVRVPLIDHVLAKRMLSMPGSMKLDSQTPKPLLVRSLGGTLPRQIVHRPKRGFTLPFEHWLRQELRPEITRNLSAMRGVLEGVVRPNAGQQVWDDFEQGRTSWTRPWSLYVLNQWCEQHF